MMPINLRNALIWTVSLLIGLLIGFNIYDPIWLCIIVFIAILALIISITRLDLTKLVCVYIVSEAASHFLKRAILLLIPSKTAYYAMLMIPSVFLILLLISASKQLLKNRLPVSAKLLALFILLSTLLTLNSRADIYIPMTERIGEIHRYLEPMLVFFIGLLLPFTSLRSIGKTMLFLLIVSAAYGTVQFVWGPTIIDRVWAFQLWDSSIQAKKVLLYLLGIIPEFRVYSFLADPLNWGIFINAALIFCFAHYSLSGVHIRKYVVLLIGLSGLFMTLSRSSFLFLILSLIAYFVISHKWLTRTGQIAFIIFLLFPVSSMLSSYISEAGAQSPYASDKSSEISERFETTGTLSDRTIDLPSAGIIVRDHWGIGRGFAYKADYTLGYQDKIESMRIHNAVFNIIIASGLPGFLLFILFIWNWLKESFYSYMNSGTHEKKAIAWMMSFVISSLIVGYFSGIIFTHFFCLIAGITAGMSSRFKTQGAII